MSQPAPGRVVFLLTDIEGSASHWQRRPKLMRVALQLHDRLVAAEVERFGGSVLTSHGEGDSYFAVFDRIRPAVECAASIQRHLRQQPWPRRTRLRVRMAIHDGQGGPDYRGPSANRCARLRSCAHGGQVLLSSTAAGLASGTLPDGFALRDLGEHSLRDVPEPERVFQLVIKGMPSRFRPLHSLGASSHNLPELTSSFVGRRREIAYLKRVLLRAAVVSLVGPAGTGKTRLALKVARDLREQYAGGTWFIDLAPLRDPQLLVQVVMAALGFREESTRAPLNTLQEALHERRTLLILDNCEHLVDATARLVERLAATCPELKVLTTSREALNIEREVVFPVTPLSVEIVGGSTSGVHRSEAAQLFIERARSARPGFTPGERGLAAIGALCSRLDGLPLAIELAAARVAVMSPAEVLTRLDDRFTFLSGGGRRTALARHQTLRAAIDWSYQLLDERERTLFHRLSVFSGSFGLESVEAVCGGDPLEPREIVGVLQRIVTKSLVMVREEREQVRYVMLETLRDFARERLVASGQVGSVRRSHLDHYLALAANSARDEGGPTEAPWIERLERDYDNFIAGLDWARSNDIEACLRLCGGLTWFWLVRGRFSEGRQRIADALVDGAELTAARADALRCVGRLALPQRDYAAAIAATESSLAISRRLNDRQQIGRCLNNLAVFAMHQDAFEEASQYYEESLAVFREIGNQSALAILLGNFGVLQSENGALEEGRRLLEETIEIHHNLQNGGPEATFRAELAVNYLCRGDREAAQTCALEGVRLASALGDRTTVALCLEALAWLAAESGHAETALRLTGAVRQLRRVLDVLPSPVSQKREARWLAPIRLRMPERAEGLEREGELLAIDDAFALAEGVGRFSNAPSGSESRSLSG